MEKHFEETIVEVFHVQKSYPKNKGKIRQPSFPDLGWYVCMHLAEAKVVSQEWCKCVSEESALREDD